MRAPGASDRKVGAGFRKIRCSNKEIDRRNAPDKAHDDLVGLSPAEIFTPFGLERSRGIVVAVSGGGDSLALLFLLHDHLATLRHAPPLVAVTVDHRLRAESGTEAQDVAALCARHGIAHRILAWDGEKPAAGVAAAARAARYRLLVGAALQTGADTIVTGHTRDDQIETFLMRKARSSGHAAARGLAAMAPRVWLEGFGPAEAGFGGFGGGKPVELIRPLLGVSRQALREELRRRGIGWIDDPSNTDTDYERPRVRMGAAAEVDSQAVLAEVVRAASLREHDNALLAAALGDPASLAVDANGTLLADAGIYAALPDNARLLFAGVLAALAGGRRFLPGDGERRRIDRALLGEDTNSRLTLCGALVERGADGGPHRFRRERRNLGPVMLPPGEDAVWDGRFRLYNAGAVPFEVAAPGLQALAVFLKENRIGVDPQRREALAVLPALFRDGKLAALPFARPFVSGQSLPQGVLMQRHFALFDHVLPGHDLALALAVETRIGRTLAA